MKQLFKKRKWNLEWYIDEDNHGSMESKCGNFFEFVIALFTTIRR